MACSYLSVAILSIFALNVESGMEEEQLKPFNQAGISPRIIGGIDAVNGQANYQGSLQINGSHHCGCVIISAEFLLTAGHCIANQNEDNMEILVGTNKLNSLGGTRYKVKKVIKHEFFYLPEHLQPDVTYDIALVWLQDPIEFTDTVQKIKYSTEEIGENEKLQTTGWGYYKWSNEREMGEQTDSLQVLNVTSITNDECEKRVFRSIHQSILCTLNPVGQGICHGDSGGPLVNFNNELVGIVNWTKPCAHEGHPDGFARLSYFYTWIEKMTRKAKKGAYIP